MEPCKLFWFISLFSLFHFAGRTSQRVQMKFCWDYFALDFGFYQDFNYLYGFVCLASTLHSITSRCRQLNVAFPLVVFVLLILYFSFLLHYHCGMNRIFTLSMQTILCYSSVLRSFTGLYFFTNLLTANVFVLSGRYRMSGLL